MTLFHSYEEEPSYLVIRVRWEIFAIKMCRQYNTSRRRRVFGCDNVGKPLASNRSVIGKLILFDMPVQGFECRCYIVADQRVVFCARYLYCCLSEIQYGG